MRISKKIKKLIVKDPFKLTTREYHILVSLAESEIASWSAFLSSLHTYYDKGTKSVATGSKGRGLGKKV